jgi:hypothetical protein
VSPLARQRLVLLGSCILAAACEKRLDALGGSGPVSASWTPAALVERKSLDLPALFPLAKTVVFDDEAGLLLPPNMAERLTWPEHPQGAYRQVTNSMGLLETEEVGPKQGLRLLVLGDSHMMSVNACESFPNLVEAGLREHGHRGADVINAGVPYTGPSMYLLRLRRYLALEPDGVVVSLFTGNDFWDDVYLKYDMAASPKPPPDPRYAQRVTASAKKNDPARGQGLGLAHWLLHWPGTEAFALAEVLASLTEIEALCEEQGLLFAVVVLPTKTDVDEDEPDERAEALATLDLTEEQAGVIRRLGRAAKAALEERGVPCVDPYDEMKARTEPFYWRRDHHLNHAGHALVAEQLLPVLERMLAGRPSR